MHNIHSPDFLFSQLKDGCLYKPTTDYEEADWYEGLFWLSPSDGEVKVIKNIESTLTLVSIPTKTYVDAAIAGLQSQVDSISVGAGGFVSVEVNQANLTLTPTDIQKRFDIIYTTGPVLINLSAVLIEANIGRQIQFVKANDQNLSLTVDAGITIEYPWGTTTTVTHTTNMENKPTLDLTLFDLTTFVTTSSMGSWNYA